MAKRVIVSIVLSLLLLSVAGATCIGLIRIRRTPEESEPVPNVTHVAAPPVRIQADYRVRIVAYGSARPKVRIQIAPQVSGEVIYRSPKLFSGRMVRGPDREAGAADVLFKIDPRKFTLVADGVRKRIGLLEARVRSLDQERQNLQVLEKVEAEQLALAADQLKRTREVLARGAGTRNELDVAQAAMLAGKRGLRATQNQLAMIPRRLGELTAELEADRVRLRQAELDLEHATYASPIGGRVIGCQIERGEHVQVGQVCGEIYGTRVMEIPVSIPAGDLAWIDAAALQGSGRDAAAAGKLTAQVRWTGGERTIEWLGRVDRIEAGLEARTRTARLVVVVDNSAQPKSPGAMLDLNMYCEVIVRARTVPAAFVLPRSAVLPDGRVYVAAAGKLALREVAVARYTDDEAMILPGGGLSEGDRVIVTPLARPVIGMRVAVEGLSETQGAAPATRAAVAPSAAE